MYIPFHIFKINYNSFEVIITIFLDRYIYLYIYKNISIIFLQFFVFNDFWNSNVNFLKDRNKKHIE
jgi:hypothetical protein